MSSRNCGWIGVVCLVVSGLGATDAWAGSMHARAVIGLGVHGVFAGHNGIAHATRQQGSKYRIAHAELGNLYTYGNAGSGHAHHHNASLAGENDRDSFGDPPPPTPGDPGFATFANVAWGVLDPNTVFVRFEPTSFLQIDVAGLPVGGMVSADAALVGEAGFGGTVSLLGHALLDGNTEVEVQLTGVFEGLAFALESHPNSTYSLRFPNALTWEVPGSDEYEISLESTIVPEPALGGLLFVALPFLRRRR
jgi:hypothetical protein